MDLLIASRQSDLARLQAYQVGLALKKNSHKIEYHFRESLGDINQDDPLWEMPEKGVFTEDFREGLIKGQWDLVVHSWKDLPIDPLPKTEIVATLPRADARDVFLCKKSRLQNASPNLHVFSSSPRRIHNLEPVLKKFFPQPVRHVEFSNVRGNILTRVRKMMEDPNVDGLVVAKAALDRLLSIDGDEFKEGQKQLQTYLQDCHFQVLPLSLNPTAAAQGALAIEIKKDRPELRKALAAIHCQKTWQEASSERSILKKHGGGCHQKIGISVLQKDYGTIEYLKGETENGEPLDHLGFSEMPLKLENPYVGKLNLFSRQDCAFTKDPVVKGHFISRDTAVPDNTEFSEEELLWASGVTTWEKLADRGYWVSGCSDGLGEESPATMGPLCQKKHWARWSHTLAPAGKDKFLWATYKLVPKEFADDLSPFKEFYWMSGTQFERAVELQPLILKARHFCGLGHTYQKISDVLKAKGIENRPQALPSRSLWLQAIEEHKK